MQFYEVSPVAGIDEAGRGALAGPVMAAAVILPDQDFSYQFKDSKQLTAKQRQQLYHLIIQQSIAYATAWIDPAEIDNINILRATEKAMERAVQRLAIAPAQALVDGGVKPRLDCQYNTVTGGDKYVQAISAASIMAKVTRDQIMADLAQYYPGYDLARNKGYGTAKHCEALHQRGLLPIHRKSFEPCRSLVDV